MTTETKVEAVAWAELTASGRIAYFDGRPMVMFGPVGNEHHPVALYPATAITAMEGEVERLRGALERIAAPHDCGCKPCTSTCRSDLALQITVEAMREEASEALTKESP